MPSFYLFFSLCIYGSFCRDTGLFSPCQRHLTLYLLEMESGLLPFHDGFFVAILVFLHLVGVMCSLFVGNGIYPFSFVVTYSALHIRH